MIKYFAINKYYKHLYSWLKKDYGASDSYSSEQIKGTISTHNFSKKHIAYAYALFLKKEQLNEVLAVELPTLRADILRAYIAKRFYYGNKNYGFKEHVLEEPYCNKCLLFKFSLLIAMFVFAYFNYYERQNIPYAIIFLTLGLASAFRFYKDISDYVAYHKNEKNT